jgi:ATP-dependent DNA helicase RecQ
MLLHYFGEDYNIPNCEHCDNCLNPKIKVEAKELLITVLESVTVLKEKQKTDYLIDFLIGKETSDIENYGHDKLEEFGSGADEEKSTWESVISQALLGNYLKKDIENYGIIKLTKKGKDFLKNPVSFKIIKEDEDENDLTDLEGEDSEILASGAGSGGAADPVLFSMMKDLRKKISKKLDVPPYVIFQPSSLEAMATSYPITMDELQNIPGVGSGKAKRYGQEFLDLIKTHVEENEITRPEDLRVKTVPNKSKLKVSIVQAIDRKVALDDLAESKGIDFNEMLSEVEAIVYSGTKISIDYFLTEVMSQDVIDDIYSYFKETEKDDLEKAQEELPEYEETEIRLVRIKFFSEMAN